MRTPRLPSLRPLLGHRALRGLAALACLTTLAACDPFTPNLGPDPFRCARTPPLCPDGYACVLTQGVPVCTLHGEQAREAGTREAGQTPIDMPQTCPDVDLEPNDSTTQATPLPRQSVTLEKLALCPVGDVDFYSLDLLQSDNLTVDLFQTLAQTQVADLEVLAGDGKTVLGSATGANTDQHVALSVPSAGKYYIYVLGDSPLVTTAYSLQIQIN
jgi:hypothetical protein